MKLHKPEMVEGVIREMDLRFTPSGREVCSVRIGLADGRVIPGEAWGELAELLVRQYDTGSIIAVTGSYKEREWVDRDDKRNVFRYFGIREVLK